MVASSSKWLPRVSLGVGLTGTVAALALAAHLSVERASVVCRIDEAEYSLDPSGRNLDDVVAFVSKKASQRTLSLVADDIAVDLPWSSLGRSVDQVALKAALSEGLRKVRGRPRSLGSRVAQAALLLGGSPDGHPETSFETPLKFVPSQAQDALIELARRVDRPAIDAELLIAEHRIVPAERGRRLSVAASLERLRDAGPLEDVIALDVEVIEPSVSERDLLPVDVARVLATFETSFLGKAGPRAVNIRTAARFLNGAVILPGEVLSFNSRVGRRVHGRGFVDAPVIVNDELDEDVGGGVCQVATTLHAAAIFGNLEVVERRSHSRPSGYAPIGLDATVIDGKVDLRLRNPYPEALLVHAWIPKPYVVRVELLGRTADVEVQHSAAATHAEPFSRRIWHKPEAPPGGFVQKQKGSPGMDVVSYVVARKDGKEVARRHYSSKYYPVPEVFYVGEGFLAAKLPPMPTEAVSLVVDGEDVGAGPLLPEAASRDMTRAPTIDESNGISPDSTARPH